MTQYLSAPTRIALVVASLVLVGIIAVFARRQNRAGRMGGAIAPAKQAWLAWAVFVWFALSPLLAFELAVAWPLRILFGSFGLAMWLRGIAELLMLYVWRNWRPPYGIAHDAFCLALLLGGSLYFSGDLRALTTALDRWLIALLFVLVLSLVLEIIYAAVFFRVVAGKTTGHDGVWFASQDDPVFRRLLRTTAICNIPLYVFVALFLWHAIGGFE